MTGTIMTCAVLAQMLVRPWSQTNAPLDERVAADFKDKAHAEAFVHYAVPMASDLQRLPDVYPHDGAAGAPVRIVMAQDEYEPGSFLIWGLKDLGKVELEVSDLKQVKVKGEGEEKETGVVFPKEDVDLKVVKCWYQNGNAWYSYFADTGSRLVPELLLHDEGLIRADERTKSNYARLTLADGTVKERWLNAPRQMERQFQSMLPWFADADTLQPVTIRKGAFKQFILTVHARPETPAGVYRGEVKVKGEGERRMGSIPVVIRVLDFELPQPTCYFDPEKPFLVNFYSYDGLSHFTSLNGGDLELAKRQFRAVMDDYAAHNQTLYWLRGGGTREIARARAQFDIAQAAGLDRETVVCGTGIGWGPTKFEAEASAARCFAVDRKFFGDGVKEIYVGHGDEPGAEWLKNNREIVRCAQKAGYKFILAGGNNIFREAGYQYDWHNVADRPEDSETTKAWNLLGGDKRVAWYANQHVGAENPALSRRQNGIAAYLSNYAALSNYAHHFGPYNDDTDYYKPMVFAYGQYKGVIDTLQWEGFREGVDDIRYATALVRLAKEAEGRPAAEIETRYAGRQALQYLAAFNGAADDLDACRAEMINHILKLRKALGK